MYTGRVRQLADDWSCQKPTGGGTLPSEALDSLSVFDGRAVRLQEEGKRLAAARLALEMDIPTEVGSSSVRIIQYRVYVVSFILSVQLDSHVCYTAFFSLYSGSDGDCMRRDFCTERGKFFATCCLFNN